MKKSLLVLAGAVALAGSATAAVFAAVFLLVGASGTAEAQSYIWGGTGSTTTTTNYSLGTNWANPPAGAPPVAGGQGAVFGSTGNATVLVNVGGPIAPDSWTFNAASQSYTAGGTAINFGLAGATGGIINNANAGQTISITSNIGEVSAGVQVQQLGNSTLTLFGTTNTYTGATIVSAGTLALQGSITSNVVVSGTGTFNNFAGSTVIGTVNASGTRVNNNGTISGLVTNTGGDFVNATTGHLNGGVTITGGQLNTTGAIAGGLTNSAVVIAMGTISGAIANFGSFNVSGVLSSDSTFTNASTALLNLNSSTSYTATGLVTNSGAITVANQANLTATAGGITNTATGTITVASGGTVNDDLNNAGLVINNGAYNANVATNTGTIANAATWTGNVTSNATGIVNNGIWAGNVLANTGTIVNNLTWTGTIANAGTFNNSSGATVSGLVTNSGSVVNAGTLGGGLTNTAGTTTDTGSIAGTVNVTGGTLTGNGMVANLAVGSGGTFAPGNGTPGTSMTVTGNLAFASGALYLVQINPATASLANVTGTATLGGATVNAIYANGSYVAKQYTILSAAGGVSGTFNSLINTNLPSAFKASLGYDGHDAYLNLALNYLLPTGSGLNVNQKNVGSALVGFFDRNGGIPLVFGALTPAGLTQASGELATGTQQATFSAMNLFMGVMTDPFLGGRGNPVTPPAASQYASDTDASGDKPRSSAERDAYGSIAEAMPRNNLFDPRWSIWAAGFGGSQTTDGNAALGSNITTSRVFGTAVGADYLFSPATMAGFSLAGGGTNFNIANGLGTGRSDLFQAGAFVRHTVGAAYVTGALAYGWQEVITNRTVSIAGIDQLQAKFNSNAFSGRFESGYRFATPWIGVTPYAAGQFTTYNLPAYAEQAIVGANTFALAYSAKSVTDARSEIGVRTDKSWAMPDSIFTLRGRFAWAHDYNTDRSIGATFQTLPGASFVVNGAAHSPDKALTIASAEVKWRGGFSLAGTFEGEFSNNSSSYAGKGIARYQW